MARESVLSSGRLKAAYVGLALVDTLLSTSSRPFAHRARLLTKPLLMPTLAASLATAPGSSPTKTAVLAAQAGSWVGDVALLSERRRPFVIGTTGFAAAHAAYVTGFARRRTTSSRLVDETPARALAGLWAATAPVMAWNARREGVAPVVATYSAALTSMVVSATRLDPSVPASTRRIAAAGGLLFLLSDSTLGFRKFVLDDPPPAMEGTVMATYTAAQFLLSEAAARL